MGVVLVVRTPDGRELAMKLLHRVARDFSGSEDTLRFVREARIASAVTSPHVVPVVDGGMDERTGAPFLVMERMKGFDLGACVQKTGALHPTVAVRVVMQAAKGLRAAHEAKVIHRDVKPQNLFLAHDTVGGVTVRVCDFGVAKGANLTAAITRTGKSIGTPLYMAPEQLLDAKHVDGRADVWGLGMTLYEALAGRSAHADARSLPDLAVAVMNNDTPPIQDLAPWLDPGLATVVHGALIRDEAARCPSMAALIRTLAPFAGGTDRLHKSMLCRVPDDIRSKRAARVAVPKKWAGGKPSVPPPAPPESSKVLPKDDDIALAATLAAPASIKVEPRTALPPTRLRSRGSLFVVLVGVTVVLGVVIGVATWWVAH